MRGVPFNGSADVITTDRLWPRRGVVVDVAIAKAFISTDADVVIDTFPSVALTKARYGPRGRICPSSAVPFQVQVWLPAGSGAAARCVATTRFAAFRMTQVTVAGRARVKERTVVGANRSASCG